MSQIELNLGILAHVDAGKTTLTERLLYEAGAIDAIGSVDAGTTQTDALALERQRGITIRSAVASFTLGCVHVNLIDTPGHPDFIAEVERVLSVLDGAVLVISAVEGVQPQTRILMRALRRLRIPTLLFVNKIDRAGAQDDRLLAAIAERLAGSVVAMGTVHQLGTRDARFSPSGRSDAGFRARLAEVLADNDDGILAAYVEDGADLPYGKLFAALVAQVAAATTYPVFFGSAITGAGVETLMAGIADLLPVSTGDPEGPLSGRVFKIERDSGGERIAYMRLFSGTIRTRDLLRWSRGLDGKVTAIAVFGNGSAARRPSVSAGAVAKLWGLHDVQVGDTIGATGSDQTRPQFLPPTLESVVTADDRADGARLRVALSQLAEQDPLINLRENGERGLSVSLYGEVQKEVIQATLADEFGIAASFRETTPIYIERPAASGEAIEVLRAESNPYLATIGLRVDPAPPESGIAFRLLVDHRAVPLYIYGTLPSFAEHMERYVRDALSEGPLGWPATDCVVTMTTCAYSVPDGPPSRRGPLSTAADFRKLTPLVMSQALAAAGTVVCEPTAHVRLEIPPGAIGAVSAALARLGAAVEVPSAQGDLLVIETVMAAAGANDLQRRLPSLTGGEGVLESRFAGHRPVTGDQPSRRPGGQLTIR